MLNYLTFFTGFELQCLFVALFCLIKDREYPWKSMCLYLLITCITELTGIYLKRQHHVNQWPYNILLVFQITLISYMFYGLLKRSAKGGPVVIGGFVFLAIFYIIDIVQHGFFRFNVLTYNAMSVFFVIYSLFYFYQLLKEDQYINLKYSAAFWWVCGVLFFYFGDTAVNLFRGKLSMIMITPKHALPYYILIVLNIILYSCWSYSFICRKWATKRSEIL
jgi:hypothetical protein